MSNLYEILQSEIERLFTLAELTSLVKDALDLDVSVAGGDDLGKAARAKKIIQHCQADGSIDALVDAVIALKGEGADPRILQITAAQLPLPSPSKDLGDGFSAGSFIAEGGTGAVYAASREGDAGSYAVKLLRPELAQYRRGAARWLAHQRLLAKQRIPGVARVVRCGTAPGGVPFVIQERAAGEPLSSSRDKGSLDFEKIARVLAAVCKALGELHARGIAHGGLKPSKVLVDWKGDDPAVTLLPGGNHLLLFRPQPGMDRSGTGTGAGALLYCAPEQLRGELPGIPADIYSFGLLAYEVAVGYPLHHSKNPAEVILGHLRKEPQAPSKKAPRAMIPARFDDTVLGCLEKDPPRRPDAIAAVEKELLLLWQDEKAAREMAAGIRPASIEEFEEMAAEFLENPDVQELAEEVVNLARGAKAWERGIAVLKQAVEKVKEDAAVRKDILYRLAAVLERDIRDFDEAASCYRQILESSAGEEAAEKGLMECLKHLGRYDELVVAILDKLEKETDEQAKASLMHEVARLYEKESREPEKALLVLLPMLQSNPFDREIVDAVARLAETTGKWDEVFGVINAAVNQSSLTADKAVALMNLAAHWYLEKLGRNDFALLCYQKVLALAPSDEKALTGVARIQRLKGEHKELVASLQRLAELKAAGPERRGIKLQIAGILQHNLGDAKQAEGLLREIFDEDPHAEEAFGALEKILLKEERWKDLAQVVARRAEAIEDRDKKVVTLYALAEMQETRLGSAKEAIRIHQAIIGLKPDYMLSLKALELLLASAGDMKALVEVLDKETAVVSTPKQRFDLLLRRAQIEEEEFLEHARALDTVDRALEIDGRNLAALALKARLLAHLERHEQLAEVFEKQVQLEGDAPTKVTLLRALARLCGEKLQKNDMALEVLEKALPLADARRQEVLADLVDAGSRAGAHDKCILWLEELAAQRPAPAEKAALWVKIGDIRREFLGDGDGSLKAYQKAIDFDRANTAAAAALKAAFAVQGDHGAALHMLQKQVEATDGAIAKSRLLCEMGRIHRRELKDAKKAIEQYEKAFQLDPTSAEAGEPLAELYRDNGRWGDAIRVFEHFAASASAMKREKALELFLRYGEAALVRSDYETARKAFARAMETDPKDGYAIERSAFAAFTMKDWAAAAAAYGDYLLRFGADLEPAASVAAHLALADCHVETGELPRALEMLGSAIEKDPGNVAAMRKRAAILEKRGAWEEAVADLKAILERAADDKEKFALIVRIGDAQKDRLADNEKAAKSYQAALAVNPDDRATLLKLMQLFMGLERWQKVVEVVLKLADLVEDKRELAAYYKTAASLCDQYLGRKDDALSYYELAIENDPSQLGLLDAMAVILTDKQEWIALERTYRKMLDRLPEGIEKEVKANLWHKLAELYLHRLGRTADAVNAFETALKLDPTQREWMQALSDLYGDDMRYGDKAIALNRELLQVNPYRVESYATISRVYRKKGKYDQSWCAASTITALGEADEDVLELYKAYRTEEPANAAERMTEEMWNRYLVHPSVDDTITGVFRIIEGAVLQAKGPADRGINLKPEQKIDPAATEEILPRMFHYAAGVLGISLPDFYAWRDDRNVGIIFAPTWPPAIVVGGEALKEENSLALAFIAARHLTYYLPGYYLRVFLQSGTALSTWFLSALKHVVPQFPVPGDIKSKVPDMVSVLKKHLDKPHTDLLTAKIQAFMESATGGVDVKRWAAGIDYTADRAGLLLCNDMAEAMSVAREFHVEPWFAPVKDRISELALFSVGDEHFALREKLGIAIQTE